MNSVGWITGRKSGGTEHVGNGGVDSAATISSGDYAVVYGGGIAIGTVLSGGREIVATGGLLSGATTFAGTGGGTDGER